MKKREKDPVSLQSRGKADDIKTDTLISKKSQAFMDNIITDTETAKEKGRKGGLKSGEVRREDAQRRKDARETVKYMLGLAAKGKLKDNLKELGFPDDECTNLAALNARLFTAAIQNADLESYFALLKIAGYDPEETRKERESLAADRRREMELEAKISALGKNTSDTSVSVSLNGEGEGGDVMIYMPQISAEESCQFVEPDAKNSEENNAKE